MCDKIGITSKVDREELLTRQLSGPEERYLRMFGTYVFDPEEEENPAGFFIGTSCGSTMLKPTPEQIEEDKTTDTGLRFCLVRDSRHWNLDDRMFVKPLRLTKRLRSPSDTLSADSAIGSAQTGFHVTWKRLQDASTKTWSAEIVDRREVLGKLELCLPYIQVCGKLLCDEFGACVNEYLLHGTI